MGNAWCMSGSSKRPLSKQVMLEAGRLGSLTTNLVPLLPSDLGEINRAKTNSRYTAHRLSSHHLPMGVK